MSDGLLSMEALRCVALHVEPLRLRGDPAGVDPLVLYIGPMILAVVHLMTALLEPVLDVPVDVFVVLWLGAERVPNGVRNLPYDLLGRGIRRADLQEVSDLFLESFRALDAELEPFQPAAVRILALSLAQVLC